MTGLDLHEILRTKRILVCCGSGGIGKTTVSAALGVQGALMGKSVLALTIDPARRLANSLGLEELGNEEKLVPPDKFAACGHTPSGSLYAMMLDTKRTFDDLIERYAPSEEIKQNILDNRFYQNLSSAMAGSHEYLAMEKLYQIYLQGNYDLIVLDTPPTRHALDFLEAPGKVRAFFDRSISQWFVKPYLAMGKLGLNLFNRTAFTIVRMVERVTGAEFLREVSEFVTGLADAFDIFRSRAEEVMRLLQGRSTSFLLVTGTERASLEEASYFYDRLHEARLPFGGVIVNRVHGIPTPGGIVPLAESALPASPDPSTLDPAALRRLRGTLPLHVAEALVENGRRYRALCDRDAAILRDFARVFPERVPIRTVPVFDEDIHDMAGLLRIDEALFPVR